MKTKVSPVTPSEPQPGFQDQPHWPGLIETYRSFLPVNSQTPVVTLFEGNTPLLYAHRISQEIGRGVNVYLKYDGLNPTGSFKDRGMTLAISKAKEAGAKAVICASTGNTSAAASAYAVRAGLKPFVLIPDGYVALGKLAQALLYGAEVLAINGNFDDCLNLVRGIAEDYPVNLVNSVNPYRLEGQKTAAFEVVDQLGEAPDWLTIPVGNAGNISAYWMGFCQYHQHNKCQKLPHMMGFQAAGAAPIVEGHSIKSPQTVATAIRIGNPANWKRALGVQDASQGNFGMVSDEEILSAYRMIAREEGIFCEPASAASVAGLLKIQDQIPSYATVVSVLTGNGLKDPQSAIDYAQAQVKSGIPSDVGSVAKAMGL